MTGHTGNDGTRRCWNAGNIKNISFLWRTLGMLITHGEI